MFDDFAMFIQSILGIVFFLIAVLVIIVGIIIIANIGFNLWNWLF